MQITEITVSAGRTFNDPYENFSNYRPSVTLKATISEKESVDAATSKLQEMAENAVDRAKKRLLERSKELSDRASKKYQLESDLSAMTDDIPF